MLKNKSNEFIRVNMGCGFKPMEGWHNYEKSWARFFHFIPDFILFYLRKANMISDWSLKHLRVYKKNSIKYADATVKIPEKSNSCAVIYSNHMIEHLSFSEAILFLNESFRVLTNGGVIRIGVPNLKFFVNKYLETKNANEFMTKTLLGRERKETFIERHFVLGEIHHKWMYDENSLMDLLKEVGFSNVTSMPAGKTMIKDSGDLNLFDRCDESIYVEGVK